MTTKPNSQVDSDDPKDCSVSSLIIDSESPDIRSDNGEVQKSEGKQIKKICSSQEFDSTIIQGSFNYPIYNSVSCRGPIRSMSNKSSPIKVLQDTTTTNKAVSQPIPISSKELKSVDWENVSGSISRLKRPGAISKSSIRTKNFKLTPYANKIIDGPKHLPHKTKSYLTESNQNIVPTKIKRVGSPLKNEISAKSPKLPENLTFFSWVKYNEELLSKLKSSQTSLILSRYMLIKQLNFINSQLENYVANLTDLNYDVVKKFKKLEARAKEVFDSFK